MRVTSKALSAVRKPTFFRDRVEPLCQAAGLIAGTKRSEFGVYRQAEVSAVVKAIPEVPSAIVAAQATLFAVYAEMNAGVAGRASDLTAAALEVEAARLAAAKALFTSA